jgi:hypothetical protein
LKNGFENSELKINLEKNIQNKNLALKKILNDDFIEVVEVYTNNVFSANSSYYFKKDKTPLWIKKIFNYL